MFLPLRHCEQSEAIQCFFYKSLDCRVATLLAMTFVIFSTPSFAQENFSKKQICKATISTLMGRNPTMMKVYKEENDVLYISYVRDDNTTWKTKCKTDGNRILWGTHDGRWRNNPMDSEVSYSIKDSNLTITELYTDGSNNSKTYSKEDLN